MRGMQHTMDENQEMKRFADKLWEYFKPKIEELTRSNVWYFRAQVTKPALDGKITVQRPFDEEIALPYVSSMENAAVGTQVTVFVFGSSMTNAVICGNGSLSILGGSPSSGGGGGDAENAVLYIAQILSSAQQAQARSNIGAVSTDALSWKQDVIEAVGLLKGDGSGGVTAAEPGTDYLQTAPVTSVDGKTGAVTLSDSYATPTQLAEKQQKIMVKGVLEGDGSGNINAAATLEATLVDYPDSGGGTSDYAELENKPQINGVALEDNKTSEDLSLYGDGNPPPYPVTSVNNKTGAVRLTASDVGAISELPVASTNKLGGIMVGTGLSITEDGTLSATGGGTADAVDWSNVSNKPTTISGYGITDAKIDDGTITLGTKTITPLTTAPVTSVNEKQGTVVLNASDVGAVAKTGDTMTGNLTVGTASLQTNGYVTGTWLRTTANTALSSTPTQIAVLNNGWIYSRTPAQIKSDIGLGNVDNIKQYSSNNPPPYPVTSVDGKTGTVDLSGSYATPEQLAEKQQKIMVDGVLEGDGKGNIQAAATLEATLVDYPDSGGGTTDYTELENKPQINGVALEGNKTSKDFGLYGNGNIPPYPVDSVDGQTGTVTLYDLKYTEQSLTSAQKQQARLNIDVPATSEVLLLGDTVTASYINMSNTLSVGSLLKVTSVDASGNPTALAAAVPGTDYMPAVPVTTSDNGKTLKVVNGAWTASN